MAKSKLSKETRKLLIEDISKYPFSTLVEKYKISYGTLDYYRKKYGINTVPFPSALSDSDKEFILKNHRKYTITEISNRFDIDIGTAKKFADENNFTYNRKVWWTEEQEIYFKQWFPHFGQSRMSKIFGKSKDSIRNKAKQFNIKVLPTEQRICYHCKNGLCIGGKRNICQECLIKKRIGKRMAKDPFAYKLQKHVVCARRTSKRKGLECNLDIEFLSKLWDKQDGKCFYTGIKMVIPEYLSKDRKYSMSIDRIDSSKGYTKDNVVLCCCCTNIAKINMLIEQFVKMCGLIAENATKNNIKSEDDVKNWVSNLLKE